MSVKKIAYILLGLVILAIGVGIVYVWQDVFIPALKTVILASIPLILAFLGVLFLLIGWAYEEPIEISREEIEKELKEIEKEESEKASLEEEEKTVMEKPVKRTAKKKRKTTRKRKTRKKK
ncbi:hypothetical protein J7K41_01605 [Candidatus Micrarchaeota archaeon]|nr:hypothetical protein [Candidatus Micrarchaeota archaeon]